MSMIQFIFIFGYALNIAACKSVHKNSEVSSNDTSGEQTSAEPLFFENLRDPIDIPFSTTDGSISRLEMIQDLGKKFPATDCTEQLDGTDLVDKGSKPGSIGPFLKYL